MSDLINRINEWADFIGNEGFDPVVLREAADTIERLQQSVDAVLLACEMLPSLDSKKTREMIQDRVQTRHTHEMSGKDKDILDKALRDSVTTVGEEQECAHPWHKRNTVITARCPDCGGRRHADFIQCRKCGPSATYELHIGGEIFISCLNCGSHLSAEQGQNNGNS